MTDEANRVLEEALALPREQRVEVAECLLSSLDSASRAEIDAFWVREAKARLDAYRRGETEAVPASEAMEELRRKYQE